MPRQSQFLGRCLRLITSDRTTVYSCPFFHIYQQSIVFFFTARHGRSPANDEVSGDACLVAFAAPIRQEGRLEGQYPRTEHRRAKDRVACDGGRNSPLTLDSHGGTPIIRKGLAVLSPPGVVPLFLIARNCRDSWDWRRTILPNRSAISDDCHRFHLFGISVVVYSNVPL
jgi:hypothetical protein